MQVSRKYKNRTAFRYAANLACFLAGLLIGTIFSVPLDLIGLSALGGGVFSLLALMLELGVIYNEVE